MLPNFPSFKQLELSDKTDVEFFTQKFPPYSDFNFTSLWCWNTQDQIRLSELNGNLVVKFADYQTGDPFYSFIGTKNVDNTALQLLKRAKSEGIVQKLRLLPYETVKLINHFTFNVREDLDNFDYILSVELLENFRGTKLAPKRNYVRRFKRQYGDESKIIIIDLRNHEIHEKVVDLFYKWVKMKGFCAEESQNELLAILRFFKLSDFTKIIPIGIFFKGSLVGFWFNEIIDKQFVISHFEKASYSLFVGIYPFLVQETAKILSSKGILFVNFEQDLGIPGLREGKEDYSPITYLRKYALELHHQSLSPTDLLLKATKARINICTHGTFFE